MTFRRFLGLPTADDGTAADDTATMRRITRELESLPPDRSRYLAAFAYVLSRAAHADLDISEDETRLMEQTVMEVGGLPEAQAILVVEIAKSQARLHGGTDDYLVTREFREMASEEERLALLRCCYIVSAVDDSITAEENAEVTQIGMELGLDRGQVNGVRVEFRDRLAALQALHRAREG